MISRVPVNNVHGYNFVVLMRSVLNIVGCIAFISNFNIFYPIVV